MKNKFFKLLKTTLIAALWIGAWYLGAFAVDSSSVLPYPHDTVVALVALLGKGEFYKVVAFSLLRVLAGLLLGIFFGVTLAILCHRFSSVKSFFSPVISIIRSTPVASFVVLLWVLLDGSALAVVVAFLMVMPIVWQNTLEGFTSISRELIEVAQVYELSLKRRYEVLIIPVLSKYIFPAVITSVGLAWKSEIAAEIVGYTKDSIGMYINDAKYYGMYINDAKYFPPASVVFAWTIVIIAMSLCLEFLVSNLLRRIQK